MKKQLLLFNIVLMIGHLLFATSQQLPHTFLFCIKPELPPLTIALNRGKPNVGLAELNDYFQAHEVVRIEPWIKSATEMDRDGDIYLNRIYRVYLNESRQITTDQSISSIQYFPFILYAEPDYVHKPYYTPNDSIYSSQCSLEAVKADLAWDYWDIENGDIPGNEDILLASVDTGVDYTHPDLIKNIWVNQGELLGNPVIVDLFEMIDADKDNYIGAKEIDDFMKHEIKDDINGDGYYNIRDALMDESPFTDNIDNDNNGYIDDLIGWDVSGTSGIEDNDPFPKTGVQNSSEWAHGTHVAGILAATTDNGSGMASTMFNGSIISVKASQDGSDETEPPIDNGFEGIYYAARVGYNAEKHTIINNSWGASTSGGGATINGIFKSGQAIINIAFNNYGAIIVAAAGNGVEDAYQEEYAAHFPSSYDNVVSVCAMSCNGNWGNWATYHPTVDLAAPGDNILSTIIGGSYQKWDGSSMASPNAASAMGLVWSYHDKLTNKEVVELVKLSADPFIYEKNPNYIDCHGNNGEYCLGTGMIDAQKAIGQGFSPNIQPGSFTFSEIIGLGDGDGIINPGETGYLTILLKNAPGWKDAENIEAVLSVNDPEVTILNGTVSYGNIASGDSLYNINDAYKIAISSDISLDKIDFQIQVSGNSGDYVYDQSFIYNENIVVSLNQAGFPITTAEIRASPLVIDFDGDGDKEIIFGDKFFSIYMYNANGTEVEDNTFPYDTGTGNQIWGSASAADLDGDGLTDVVVSSQSKHLYIFDKNGLKVDYNSGKTLLGTPAIGNLDDDDSDFEVVIGSYSSPATSNAIFVVTSDGSDVDGFPYELGEKVKAGVALADFNGNGKDDIVIGTDSNKIHLIYDNGSTAAGFPYTVGDKIQAAPSILNIDGEKVILTGSNDSSFYAINSDGTLKFKIKTGGKIQTSPSLLVQNAETYIFFGSDDHMIYAVNIHGNVLAGWPVVVNGAICGSVVFSDLDGDSTPEVVVATDMNDIVVFHIDGSKYERYSISMESSFSGSPMITDLDYDGDLEIFAGSNNNLTVIDIKEIGNSEGYWSEFRGGFERRGEFNTFGGCTDPNYCNYDSNADWNNGSCSIKGDECHDGKLGCDCSGICNGNAVIDCDGICDGDTMVDQCGECGGDGPDEGHNCDGTPLLLEEDLLPHKYSLGNIYPNPFNPVTTIKYGLPDYAPVKIAVYDLLGRQVAILINNYQSPGFHSVVWDASSYPSGLYFIRIKSYKFSEVRKVLLIK